MGDDNEFPGLSALGLYASDIRGDGMIDRLQPHFRSIVTADPPSHSHACLLASTRANHFLPFP
jgi:hypothetical protein